MFVRFLLSAIAWLSMASPSLTQNTFTWPDGKKMALSLSFDDARSSHVDVGLPLFRDLDIDVTFYVNPPNMENQVEGWKEIVKDGHEIGNHTMYHPCTGNFDWVGYPLENYSMADMRKELLLTNQRIQEMLGVTPTTFAYTCGNTFVGRGANQKSMIPLVHELFSAGRGWLNESANDPVFVDLAHTQGVEMDGKDFENDILPRIEQAINHGSWLVLAGHEIGEPGNQTTEVDMLQELSAYVKEHTDDIWIAPVQDIAAYIEKQRMVMEHPLEESLTFCASFDKNTMADFAIGDSHIYSAVEHGAPQGTANLLPAEVELSENQGKHGNALEFKRKGKPVVYYDAMNHLDYKDSGWEGTVSLWLKLDPETDLAPGFTDPIQITDANYDDAALWVDFSDKNPRDFRLGIFGDKTAWNPDNIGPNKNPAFKDRLIKAKMPAFRSDRWTHVAFTFENINSDDGTATLYIDGHSQGNRHIPESFTWDIDAVRIYLGLNFVGLMDEVSIFKKALSADEITTLYRLPEGIKSLLD